ncbi:MAG TPA: PDZ domain-containing protein [Blastocatellia bacterium]|nr:PDZ domain-containing protein [Blastocatellia bacterium]
MTTKQRPNGRFSALSIWIILILSPSVFGQAGQFRIDYTVEVDKPESQLFHVTAEVKNINQPRLDLSLPTWTPGWYTVENYAKNILRFRILDSKGARVPFTMTRKQTWRVETQGVTSLKVAFDYRADVLALNQAKITKDFAFFTGIEIFLMAEGHRASPSQVRFKLPEGWKFVSALKETGDPMTFTAPDYDTLVDSPTEMGNFDVTRFEVEGKPHYFVATPAGAFSKEKAAGFAEMLAKVASAQSAVFGGLPYDKYVYFYFFMRPESNAGGALEHLNSHVSFAPPMSFVTPQMLIGTASHEFFHLWNVKRIRPVEMWPYDYSRENETPLLWVSEGFTNYYGSIALYRAGLITREMFLQGVGFAISGVENNDARNYISPANSSTSTWLGYDTPVAFGISYYTQGQNLAALLDLSILHDTKGAAGLDAVMRTLYVEFYKRGKGFSTDDLIAAINRVTRRDYREFFRKYVWGVEVPPYETLVGYAGYRLETSSQRVAVLNFETTIARDGSIRVGRVAPGSTAADAGLMAGDALVSIDAVEPSRRMGEILERLSGKIGESVKVNIKRGGRDLTLDMRVASQGATMYKIADAPQPTPNQLKVRDAWLKTGR